ncbi:transcriptional regulator, partial [Escherichia coli]
MAIKKSKCEDKSRYDIVADLRKRGKSLAALGRENGLSIS